MVSSALAAVHCVRRQWRQQVVVLVSQKVLTGAGSCCVRGLVGSLWAPQGSVSLPVKRWRVTRDCVRPWGLRGEAAPEFGFHPRQRRERGRLCCVQRWRIAVVVWTRFLLS